MMPTETIGLVIEKMGNRLSLAIGAGPCGLCRRIASNQPIWPLRATRTVAPGRVPLSTSRLKASDRSCSRAGDNPSDSGLAWGRGGVCGAEVGFGAGCAFIFLLPLLLLSAWVKSGAERAA